MTTPEQPAADDTERRIAAARAAMATGLHRMVDRGAGDLFTDVLAVLLLPAEVAPVDEVTT